MTASIGSMPAWRGRFAGAFLETFIGIGLA
jgi:hypothetical protein